MKGADHYGVYEPAPIRRRRTRTLPTWAFLATIFFGSAGAVVVVMLAAKFIAKWIA